MLFRLAVEALTKIGQCVLFGTFIASYSKGQTLFSFTQNYFLKDKNSIE